MPPTLVVADRSSVADRARLQRRSFGCRVLLCVQVQASRDGCGCGRASARDERTKVRREEWDRDARKGTDRCHHHEPLLQRHSILSESTCIPPLPLLFLTFLLTLLCHFACVLFFISSSSVPHLLLDRVRQFELPFHTHSTGSPFFCPLAFHQHAYLLHTTSSAVQCL